MRTVAHQEFEDRMVRHLGAFFPGQCADLGEAGVRGAIQHGLERAEAHGFHREGDVIRYLNLMFTFGRGFDVQPECAWAAPFLHGGSASTGPDRMEGLYSRAVAEQHAGRGYSGGR